VFELSPAAGGTWTENTLYSFDTGGNGYSPADALILDSAGNLYGTTLYGAGTTSAALPQYFPAPQPAGGRRRFQACSFTERKTGPKPCCILSQSPPTVRIPSPASSSTNRVCMEPPWAGGATGAGTVFQSGAVTGPKKKMTLCSCPCRVLRGMVAGFDPLFVFICALCIQST